MAKTKRELGKSRFHSISSRFHSHSKTGNARRSTNAQIRECNSLELWAEVIQLFNYKQYLDLFSFENKKEISSVNSLN